MTLQSKHYFEILFKKHIIAFTFHENIDNSLYLKFVIGLRLSTHLFYNYRALSSQLNSLHSMYSQSFIYQ